MSRVPKLRRFFLNAHLYVALFLLILLIPISLTGAILTAQDVLEPWFYPGRYGHSSTLGLDLDSYLSSAQKAFGPSVKAASIRLPDKLGGSVLVTGRGSASVASGQEEGGRARNEGERSRAGDGNRSAGPRGDAGGPPRLLTAYLDPRDGRIIDISDFRLSFFGWTHIFHENLQLAQFGGRSIVGWTGVAMLFLSLSGLYLWWPRNGAFFRGLRWRRQPTTMANLHHMLGFWISLPLTAVSITGIYLGFPQQGRQLIAGFTEISPRQGFGRAPSFDASLKAVDAAALALSIVPKGSELLSLDRPGQAGSTLWRVQLRNSETNGSVAVLVDDRTRNVEVNRGAQLFGDRIQQIIRWMHEGSHLGATWKFLVFLTGIFPSVFAVTGITMWTRRRHGERRLKDLKAFVPTASASSTIR